MNTKEIIELAEKHVEKEEYLTSSELCLNDAKELLASGKEGYATDRAIDSLRFSVGVFHPDYQKAWCDAYEISKCSQ